MSATRRAFRRVCVKCSHTGPVCGSVSQAPTQAREGSLQTLRGASTLDERRPLAVDLFCGAGGMSLGFEQAGFDIVAAVEYDPVHALIHRYNFPECNVLCRDIRRLRAADVVTAAKRGALALGHSTDGDFRIDALIGGPSCQGFSVMGLRDEEDERNHLLTEFVRLVVEVRPRVFCLENVPGLLEERFDAFRQKVLKKLRSAGYSISGSLGWLNAADFGVPQNRKRVFLVGTLDGPAATLPVPCEMQRITVAEALEGLPDIELYNALLTGDSVRLNAADRRARVATNSDYARTLARLSSPQDLAHPRQWDETIVTCSRRTSHASEVIRRFAKTKPGEVEPGSHLYRLDPAAQAPTLRAGTGRERGAHTAPRPIHPTHPRVITVREAARLHGYPDWFRFNGTQWHGHRQVGNSVPPPLARAVASELVNVLRLSPPKPIRDRTLGDADWCNKNPFHAARLMEAKKDELPPPRARRDAMRST